MPTQPNPAAQGGLFKAIERESTLAARVTEQIETFIVAGGFQPGDRFPPERELANQFGVSRTVIREAVRALAARGLLEVQPGSGTFVRSPTVASIAKSINLFLRVGQVDFDYDKIHEVRRLLEIEIAGLAAVRRTDDDLQKMEAILNEAPAIRTDRDRIAQNDVNFHAALVRATHNEIFSLLLDSIADIMLTVRQLGFAVAEMPVRALKHHWAIFEQVQAGDPEGARQAMVEHLIEAEATMREALTLHNRS